MLSVLASETCEFLWFSVGADSATNGVDEEPPFDMASEGWIGIFQYEIIRRAGGEVVSEGCTLYNRQFVNAPNSTLTASQFCAVLAPTFALLAILVAASELFCSLRFYGSFVATSIFVLAAAATQGGTFSLFAALSFCYDSNTQCDVGAAVYFSASAALSFFLACIMLCCSPRPVSCCHIFQKENENVENPSEVPEIEPPKISTSESKP